MNPSDVSSRLFFILPSRNFHVGKLALVFAILLFLLPQFAAAEFLVGESGGLISVLCDGESEIFVSAPGGGLERLALDSDFQSQYRAGESGPYSVQCGKEVKTVSVKLSGRMAPIEEKRSGPFAAVAAFSFFAAFLLALAAFFMEMKFPRKATFEKCAKNGKVSLAVFSGRELLFVEIEDPQVEGGRISVPKIKAGKGWKFEYESEGGILPAKMSAIEGGKRITLGARLIFEGNAAGLGQLGEQAGIGKKERKTRRLAKIGD